MKKTLLHTSLSRRVLSLSLSAVMALSMVGVLGGCSSSTTSTSTSATSSASSSSDSSTTTADYDFDYTNRDLDPSYDESTAVFVELSQNGSTVTAGSSASSDATSGVTVSGSDVTITAEGTYVFSGTLTDGCIYVDTTSETKVQVVLNGVTIYNADGPALYVKQADKVFVTLASGSVNNLSDGTSYVLDEDEEPNGTIFSKDDLTINGSGTLNITASYRHAVSSKDDLVITGGTFNIKANEDALRGKDCVKICDGTFNIVCGEDAIQSSNDSDETRGFVSIDGGTFTIDAGDDGVHAETLMRITGGTVTINDCYEGYEGQQVEIDGGTTYINASDDGLNAASGTSTTADQQMGDFSQDHQQDVMNNSNSFDPASQAPSGSSSEMPSAPDNSNMGGGTAGGNMGGGAAGGTRASYSTADTSATTTAALTTTADTTQTAMGGGMAEGGVGVSSENCKIIITGGTTYVCSGGDGVDSNGSFEMSGGTLIVEGPTSSADGYFDYDSSATITGGTVLMVGSTGMAQNFTDGTQAFAMTNVSGSAGQEVSLVDKSGNTVASFTSTKSFQCAVVSVNGAAEGDTATLKVGSNSTSLTLSCTATSGMGGLGSNGQGLGAGQKGDMSSIGGSGRRG